MSLIPDPDINNVIYLFSKRKTIFHYGKLCNEKRDAARRKDIYHDYCYLRRVIYIKSKGLLSQKAKIYIIALSNPEALTCTGS